MYKIEKYEGYKLVEWNGTKEDLEGFNVKVNKIDSDETFRGSIKNGYAVASNSLAMAYITKALRGIK